MQSQHQREEEESGEEETRAGESRVLLNTSKGRGRGVRGQDEQKGEERGGAWPGNSSLDEANEEEMRIRTN